jgi:plasmid stabilization system protein ParE
MVDKSIYKIDWDNEAISQLKEILIYLDKKSINAARIVKYAILEQLELLKTNPGLAQVDRLKSKSNLNFHAFVVYSYRVTYQIINDNNLIRILRIRHTSKEPLNY